VLALLFSLRKKYPALVACAVCYLVLVAPVSGVAQSGIQFVADRYSYLSCLSWALLAAGVAYTIQSKWKAEPVWIAAAAILLSLGGATWKQTEVWRDSATLWRQAIALQPKSSFAHYNLGLVLFRQGDIENAKVQYEEALRLNPFDAETQNDLGLLLATRGEMDEALRYLQAAVHSDPSYAKPYYNIGRILLRQGRAADAVEYFTTALRLAPGTAEIHENLGRAYALQGRREEAIGQFEEAVRIMKARAGADVGPRQP
jgi:protein O-mannosyl-transferase